jgi:hypothetical protein
MRAWLEYGTVGFLVEMRNSDFFTAVTGDAPNVLRLTCQVSGIEQPPGDRSRDSSS